jgi:hypothetical protein
VIDKMLLRPKPVRRQASRTPIREPAEEDSAGAPDIELWNHLTGRGMAVIGGQ